MLYLPLNALSMQGCSGGEASCVDEEESTQRRAERETKALGKVE